MEPEKINSKEIDETFSKVEKAADDLQRKLANQIKEAGYIRDLARNTKGFFMAANESQQAGEYHNMISSGLGIMNTLYSGMDSVSDAVEQSAQYLHTYYLAASTLGTNTAATGSFITPILVEFKSQGVITIPPADLEDKSLVSRCEKHDPALGKVCAQISECLYGTVSDPERSAMFMVRQAFDHLFSILAPNDEVRNSAFWKRKEDDKPDQITRAERIDFAIATKIADPVKQELMRQESKQMREVYGRLNAAHERGELNRQQARLALSSMYGYLRTWIDAVGW
jgi:hypothetical protein